MPQRPINASPDESNQSYTSDPTISRILYCDSNWGLTLGYATQDIYWRSRESAAGESATGKMDVGYFKLKSILALPVAGGGSSNGHLKSLRIIQASNNTVLATHTLGTMLNGINSDTLKVAIVDTSLFANMVCLLSFGDFDANSGWAWIGFDLSNIYCY